MTAIRILIAIVVALSSLSASARKVYNVAAIPAPGVNMPYTITIDSIDFRSDLARVYGHLLGTPNTSSRIDGFIIQPDPKAVAPGTKTDEQKATDIDGFEFTHRFQWEEDGDLPIEIDFPKLPEANAYLLRIAYPGGWYGVNLRKTRAGTNHKGARGQGRRK